MKLPGLSLSILLWNVWLLPAPISKSPRVRAGLISPLLAGHDVVVLNEAFTYKAVLTKEAGYNFSASLNGKSYWPWSFRPVDSGILILSKYPFDKVEKETFKSRGGSDKYSAKGIVMVRIVVEGVTVDIYGTHMQSGSNPKRGAARASQVQQLARFINLHSGTENSSVIVAGDMNMGPLTNLLLYNWAYENLEDKVARTAEYSKLKMMASLEDASYQNPYWQQDINRFLVRNVDGTVRNIGKPVAMVKGEKMELSDSERYEFVAKVSGV